MTATAPPGALLPLPRIQLLTERQMQGVVCVWCGAPLTPETARDLGARSRPGGTQWFPRGCKRCVRAAALRFLAMHTANCASCAPGRPGCSVRTALRGLAKEGWR
ncbi:hypothetical protein GCM10027072_28360 [Streptomyces bullii]